VAGNRTKHHTEMILIKQHNSHHVARLYMHLFCMAVNNFFYDKRLFPYLDYDLSTRVVRGVVYVRISLYTPQAKRLADELPRLKVPLDDESRTIAILQIAADKKQFFGIVGKEQPDFEALNKALSALDARPWQDIDSFELAIPQDNQLVSGEFYPLPDKGEVAISDVNVSFSLDKSFSDTHGELLPLFWHLAMVTSASIGRELYEQVGFFGTGISRSSKNRATKLVQHYRAAAEVALLTKDIRDMADDVIVDLDENDAYKRMTAELRSATHNKSKRMLPNPMYMHDRTGIILGAKGWKRIATDENCNLILSHMKVTVSTGRSRTSIKVSSILNR
jgi:hypothetical protein